MGTAQAIRDLRDLFVRLVGRNREQREDALRDPVREYPFRLLEEPAYRDATDIIRHEIAKALTLQGERFGVRLMPPYLRLLACADCRERFGIAGTPPYEEPLSGELGRALRLHVCPAVKQPWQEIA